MEQKEQAVRVVAVVAAVEMTLHKLVGLVTRLIRLQTKARTVAHVPVVAAV